MPVRKWVKWLPYWIVKKIAMWDLVSIKVQMKANKKWYYLFEVDYGEYILIDEKVMEKYKKKKKDREEKKLEKLERKMYKLQEKMRRYGGE